MLKKSEIYIEGSACFSPLEVTTSKQNFDLKIRKDNVGSRNKHFNDPDYRGVLNSNIIRRSARFLKIGLFTALKCLEKTDHKVDAILVGTGTGSFSFTEKFLLEMENKEEENLSPNLFLQSMSSILSGFISTHLKCNGYNLTYVNGGISFENALIDAMLLLEEKKATKVLVGGVDELTETYAKAVTTEDYFSVKKDEKLIFGEGASFFRLISEKHDGNIHLEDVEIYPGCFQSGIKKSVAAFLKRNKIQESEIDLLLTTRLVSQHLSIFSECPKIFYKDFIGEYATSTSFALWLSEVILRKNQIPNLFSIAGNLKNFPPKRILIMNHYKNDFTLIMVRK